MACGQPAAPHVVAAGSCRLELSGAAAASPLAAHAPKQPPRCSCIASAAQARQQPAAGSSSGSSQAAAAAAAAAAAVAATATTQKQSSMASLLPGRGGSSPNDNGGSPKSPPGCTVASAAAAGSLALQPQQQPQFRYWVDETLWSQGRVATITIEEVLDRMGAARTGGPHKQPANPLGAAVLQQQQQQQGHKLGGGAAAAAGPDSSNTSLQQLLQHVKLASEQQQPLQPPPHQQQHTSKAGVSGVSTSVSRSSSEATIPSSRTSSANSLDAALTAAAGAAGAARPDAPAPAAGELPRPLQPSSSATLNRSGSGSQLGALGAGALSSRAAAAADLSSQPTSDSSEDAALPGSSSSSGLLGPTKRPDDAVLGYHHVKQWDLLWTKSVYAIRAARQLQQGQVVSAIAGLNCLSMKKRMVQTLRMALGSHAFQIVPLSFCIPEDLPAWQSWLSSPQGAAADTGLWMLKTGQDAGRGLKLVRTQQALQVAVRPPKNPTKPQTHIKVAQQYVTDPLLLRGRKFHLRLWLLVTSHQPLRAYLHSQGLVLFSSEPYDTKRPLEGPGVRPSVGHVTNYARNEDSWVWDLTQLQQQLGQGKWEQLWQQMKVSSALTAAAVLGPLRAAHRWLQPSVSNYGFQMMGLDYLIDESLHPWLLEVNSAPSIMAVHSEPQTCELIRSTKQAMLHDMLAMVQHRVVRDDASSSSGTGSSGGGAGAPAAMSWQEELAAEMANRGGFEPVMGLFPVQQQQQHGGAAGGSSSSAGSSAGSGKAFNIPWQDVDRQLQQLLRQQYQSHV